MMQPIGLENTTLKEFRKRLDEKLKKEQKDIDDQNKDDKNIPKIKDVQVPADRILVFIKGNFVCSERDFKRAMLEFEIKQDHFVLLQIQSANKKNDQYQNNSKQFNEEPSLRQSEQMIHKESVENLSYQELRDFLIGLIFNNQIDLHLVMHLELKLSVFFELFPNNFETELSKDTNNVSIYAKRDEPKEPRKILLNDVDKKLNTLLHLACYQNSQEWVKQWKDKFNRFNIHESTEEEDIRLKQINRENAQKLMPIQIAARQCSKDIVELLVNENKIQQLTQLRDQNNCYLITTAMFNQKIQPKFHKHKLMKETLDQEIDTYFKLFINSKIEELKEISDQTKQKIQTSTEITDKSKLESLNQIIKNIITNIKKPLLKYKNQKQLEKSRVTDQKDSKKEKIIYDTDFVPFLTDNSENKKISDKNLPDQVQNLSEEILSFPFPNDFYKLLPEKHSKLFEQLTDIEDIKTSKSNKIITKSTQTCKISFHDIFKYQKLRLYQNEDSLIPYQIYKYSDAHFNCINQWSEKDLEEMESNGLELKPQLLEPYYGQRQVEKIEVVSMLFNLIGDSDTLNQNIMQQLQAEDINNNVFEQFLDNFVKSHFNIDSYPWSKIDSKYDSQVKSIIKEDSEFKDKLAKIQLEGFLPEHLAREYIPLKFQRNGLVRKSIDPEIPLKYDVQKDLYDGSKVIKIFGSRFKVEHKSNFTDQIDLPANNYFKQYGEFEEIWPFETEKPERSNNNNREKTNKGIFQKHTLLSKIMEGISNNQYHDNDYMMRRINYITTSNLHRFTDEACLNMVKEIKIENKEIFKCEIELDKWINLNDEEINQNRGKKSKNHHENNEEKNPKSKKKQETVHFLDFERTVIQDYQYNPVAALNNHWQSDLRTPIQTSFLFNNTKSYNMPKHQNIITSTANNQNIPKFPKQNKLFPMYVDKKTNDDIKRSKEKYATQTNFKINKEKGDDTKRSGAPSSRNKGMSRCKSSESRYN